MTLDAPDLHPGRAAGAGLAACLPALLLVAGGLTYSLTGVYLLDVLVYRLGIPPVVTLGGLVVALALNAAAALRLRIDADDEALVRVEVRRRPANLAVLALAAGLLAVLVAYALVENGLVHLPG